MKQEENRTVDHKRAHEQIGARYLFVPRESAERCQSATGLSGRFPFLANNDDRFPITVVGWKDEDLEEIIDSREFREYGVDCEPESFNPAAQEMLAGLAPNYRIFGRTQ